MTSNKNSETQSERLARRARDILPGGASHDSRQLSPHGLFTKSAHGADKISSDGQRIVDFACGNGALILGHGHPAVLNAAAHALESGFSYSAGSEIEIAWAETVRELMPALEHIRFTSSGNEACALAFAIAHAKTGRGAILTLAGHYCGWIAPALLPQRSLQESTRTPSPEICIARANDVDEAAEALRSGAFAAIIIEPTGASFGKVPLSQTQAKQLTESAASAGTVMIFDETITGFRVSPGGAQRLFGLKPDLTVLGKILGGGLPCGALGGRRDLMAALDNRPGQTSAAHVSHMGTGNANPVVAATGHATLIAIADGEAQKTANAAAAQMRSKLNALFTREQIAWSAYGDSSAFHIFLNPRHRPIAPDAFEARAIPAPELLQRNAELINTLRVTLLEEGIDILPWPGGLTSAAHNDATIGAAEAGFARALQRLKASGVRLTGWGTA